MKKNIFKITLFAASSILFIFPFIANAMSVSVYIPEKYASVEPGERLYFEVSVKYPENPRRKDLRLNYEIKDGEEIIAQAKFLKAIETQASFMDFIVIPASAKKKMYNINVKISDYESLSREVGTSFEVVDGPMSQVKIYLLMLVVVITFFSFIFLATYQVTSGSVPICDNARNHGDFAVLPCRDNTVSQYLTQSQYP